MKRMWVVMSALLVVAAAAVAHEGHEYAKNEGKTVTLTGEVLDLYCYMQHPESATGAEHAKCAKSCIAKGLPVGFLADNGKVYTIIGKEHEPVAALVGEHAGAKSTITGTLIEHHGVRAIELTAIGAAGTTGASMGGAKSVTGTEKPMYTCSMHPEVLQDKPGNCPKCGMTLVPVKTKK